MALVINKRVAAQPNNQIVNTIYPIGSYYETSSANFDPNTRWIGVWQKESQTATVVRWHRIA